MLPRLSSISHKPHLSYKFEIRSSKLSNMKIYGKSGSLPKITNDVQEISYPGGYIKVGKKIKYDNLQFDLYAFEGITYNEVNSWIKDHYNSDLSSNRLKGRYKDNIVIQLMDSGGNPSQKWTLANALIESVDYGKIDWSQSDLILPSISIAYDYLIF